MRPHTFTRRVCVGVEARVAKLKRAVVRRAVVVAVQYIGETRSLGYRWALLGLRLHCRHSGEGEENSNASCRGRRQVRDRDETEGKDRNRVLGGDRIDKKDRGVSAKKGRKPGGV